MKKEINAHKVIYIASYIYLVLPNVLFLLGWCKWYIGIPAALLCLYSMTVCVMKKQYTETEGIFAQANKWRLFFIFALLVCWVALSGIGGFFWQNSDHFWRNTMQDILVEYVWPVKKGSRGLVYYLGSLLPAALLGKIFGEEYTGSFLLLWVLLGVVLLYALICVWRKKVALWPLFILIFFSGLDIFGSQLTSSAPMSLLGTEHLEWWSTGMQYSSVTTQLFWVFNQSVPVWLAVMLMREEPSANIIFLCSLLLITSTLPTAGLIPIAVCYIYRNARWCKETKFWGNWKMIWRNIGGLQHNLGALSVVIVIGFYLAGNDVFSVTLPIPLPFLLLIAATGIFLLVSILILLNAKDKINLSAKTCCCFALVFCGYFVLSRVFSEPGYNNLLYKLVYTAIFFIIEVGVYLYLLQKYVSDKMLFNIVTIILMVCPFVIVGNSCDFCMRASIPALFLVMLWCIEAFDTHHWNLRLALLAAALLVGSVTPMHEIRRGLVNSGQEYVREAIAEEGIFEGHNFSGITESFYWKNIAK